jgi:hypothetical protein
VIPIRIQYDKYNRMFKLLDNASESLLVDGDVYELLVSPAEVHLEQADEDRREKAAAVQAKSASDCTPLSTRR